VIPPEVITERSRLLAELDTAEAQRDALAKALETVKQRLDVAPMTEGARFLLLNCVHAALAALEPKP
jgi:hypothetical protein